VLAGSDVVWGQEGRGGAVSVRAAAPGRRTRTIFRARRPPVPADRKPPGPGVVVGVAHGVSSLEASRSRIAFVRYATVVTERRCDGRPCGPREEEPLFRELWVGPLRGPFRRVARGSARSGPGCEFIEPTYADVSGTVVIYAEQDRACQGTTADAFRSARVVLLRGRTRTILARSTVPLGPVAIAGRYAAWSMYGPVRAGEQARGRTITVFDMRGHAVAYRLRVPLEPAGALDLDLQADGTLVVTADRLPRGSCPSRIVAWSRRRAPRLHPIARILSAGGARIAGNRIVVAAQSPDCRRGLLTLTGLRGTARTLASFGVSEQSARGLLDPYVDFDGRRAAFAVRHRPSPEGTQTTSVYVGLVR
jgi:hypothetical protein